jgi:hypothetical protein
VTIVGSGSWLSPIDSSAALSPGDVAVVLKALDAAGRWTDLVTGRCTICAGWSRLCSRHVHLVSDVMDWAALERVLTGGQR